MTLSMTQVCCSFHYSTMHWDNNFLISVNKKKSVGALISTTNPELTRYYSTVCIHESNDELQVSMVQAFTRALDA